MSPNDANGSADKLRREALALHRALDGGLDSSLQAAGYDLLGLSLKIGEGDCLLTLRLSNHTGAFVAFVGSTCPAGCLLKAHKSVRGGELNYRADKYAGKQ